MKIKWLAAIYFIVFVLPLIVVLYRVILTDTPTPPDTLASCIGLVVIGLILSLIHGAVINHIKSY